jgi:ParB/RepB/Spo0J family partition protein
MSEATVRMLELSLIHESPTNPRRTFNQVKQDELVESIRLLGVLQPVLVRIVGDRDAAPRAYEIIFGHRRFRAAAKCGLETIPTMVREMSDLEVLEAQVVENTQREDVHPLEEAEAYERLHHDHAKAVDEIAAMCGKSRAYIYARMKLLALSPASRKAFYAGDFDASIALLVARIPTPQLQKEALEAVCRGWRGGGACSYREAAEIVQRNFMLRLKDASWSLTDAELLPVAGACSTCPKRTGNQRELFEDVKGADVCTDPSCFEKKQEAAWKVRAAAARAEGRTVLEGKAAEKASYGREYVRLDDPCWEDGKQRTYKKLLGKDAPPAVLIRDQHGSVKELLPKADVAKVLREKGIKTQKDQSHQTGRSPALERARAQELELERRVLEQLSAKAPKIIAGTAKAWRWLARAAVEGAWGDSLKAIVSRRALERVATDEGMPSYGEVLFRWIEKAALGEVQGLTIEVLAARSVSSLHDDGRDGLDDHPGRHRAAALGAELARVDVAALRKKIKAEDDARQKERKEKARAKKAKTAPHAKIKRGKAARRALAAVPTCGVCGCTDEYACEGGCTWIEPDLCSRCYEAGES